jgi:hypothetical protein
MKVPVMVPRVRDTVTGKEIQLDTYKSLQKRHYGDKKLMKRLIHGLSCRNYEECAEMVPGVFGLKPSTVSHRYIRASSRKLRELMERRLEGQDIVAMFIDGKTFADDEIVIALGVKMSGEKILLGMVQTGTENERVPSTYASGNKVMHGHITKQGNKWIRWAMVEAVWPAIRKDGELRSYYERLKIKKNANCAKVATAKRLLTIVYRILRAY